MLRTLTIKETEFVETNNTTYCILTCKGGVSVIGYAFCAKEDRDFKSSLVGKEISYKRAKIELLNYIIENDLNPQIKVLKHLENAINTRGDKKKTRGDKLILRELNRTLQYKDELQETIKSIKAYLRNYIDEKDIVYQKLRENRAKGTNKK